MDPQRTIVLYKTKYGAAEQYARWLGEDLGCRVENLDGVKKDVLENYDLIIYGGGVHAGGIRGMDEFIKWMRKYLWLVDKPEKTFVFFACGMNVQNFEARAQLREVNFGKKWLQHLVCFYLDGAYNPALIRGIDKKIIGITRKWVTDKGELNLTAEERELIRRMDEGFNGIDRAQLGRLEEYVRTLEQDVR